MPIGFATQSRAACLDPSFAGSDPKTPDCDAAVPATAPRAGTAVTFGPESSVILAMVAAGIGRSLDEAAAIALCFYAEHGLGIPALAREGRAHPANQTAPP
jgi:hypothetical protein